MAEKENYTDEEMLFELKKFYEENKQRHKMSDFKGRKPSDNMIIKRFGTWLNALKLAGIKVDKLRNSDYTPEYLKNTLLEYYEKYNKVPTIRGLISKGYPTIYAYKNHFGSFKNALKEAGLLHLREDIYQFCDTYTDEELFNRLREFMKNRDRIPVGNELKENKEISFSTYERRFGSVYTAFKMIGYDIEDQRKKDDEILKKDMIEKYKIIQLEIGKTPTSRDIDEYSKNRSGFYSMGAYEFHFGSVANLQKTCGFVLTKVGRNKTKFEMIEDLRRLASELGRTPVCTELKECAYIASRSQYRKLFGSFENAILEAGLEPVSKTYFSKNNDKCLSVYELTFNDMLINENIDYVKEVYYKDAINDFDQTYRFDFMIKYSEKNYYIEIFGITNNKDYDIKTAEKIKLCKDNNIPLIEFYPDNFYTTIHGDLYSQLINKIEQYELLSNSVNV